MRELKTQRLLLRRIRREDARRIYDCWASDPEVTPYVTWDPHDSPAVTRSVVDQWLAAYARPDTYRWGICLSDSGELIGMIDVVGYRDGCPLIGYCLGRAYWNRGYATEALRAVTEELFAAGYHTLLIEAVDENIGSNRVIRKNGFEFTGSRLPGEGERKPWKRINSYRLDREK